MKNTKHFLLCIVFLLNFWSNFSWSQKPIRILSLDGGGVRGIFTARVLKQLENELKRPLSSVFDLIAGTSTGGILALGLVAKDENNNPKFSAADLLRIYTEKGEQVFSASVWHKITTLGGLLGPKYENDGLEQLLLDHFADLKLSDALTSVMVTGYSVLGQEGIEFSSDDAKNNRESKDCLMREVAMATSAAPTIFDAINVHYPWGTLENVVDGGLFANNPSLHAYVTAKRKYPDRDIEVFSIGTGEISIEELSAQLTGRGILAWVSPLLRHLQLGNSESDNDILHKLLNEDGIKNFFRLNTRLSHGHKALDNVSIDNIEYLTNKGVEAISTPIFEEMISRLRS